MVDSGASDTKRTKSLMGLPTTSQKAYDAMWPYSQGRIVPVEVPYRAHLRGINHSRIRDTGTIHDSGADVAAILSTPRKRYG